MAATFSDIAPIKPLTTHRYTTLLKDAWSIGAVPNGGYITSLFLVVARQHMTIGHPSRNQPHAINLHLEFLRRTSANLGATFTVEDLKLGSRISNLHVTLSQPNGADGVSRDNVQGYITMSNIHTEEGLSLPTPAITTSSPPSALSHLHLPPPPANLATLLSNSLDEYWTLQPPSSFPEFRKATQHIRTYLPRPEFRPPGNQKTKGEFYLDQWVRFHPEGQPGRWTNDCLGFVVDMFPQIVEEHLDITPPPHNNNQQEETNVAPTKQTQTQTQTQKQKQTPPKPRRRQARFWYPTLSLNLDIKRALPDSGMDWLFVRVQAKVIRNGRMDLQILVLDEVGEVVAISSHAALIMGTERNLRGRL